MRPLPDMHCKLDENVFSLTVLWARLLTGCAMSYVAMGGLLFYREFLYNTVVSGWPISLGAALLIVQFLLALLIALGWFARLAAVLAVISMGVVGFLFVGAEINQLLVALVLLQITALLPVVLMGPGKYSLDFYSARKHAANHL